MDITLIEWVPVRTATEACGCGVVSDGDVTDITLIEWVPVRTTTEAYGCRVVSDGDVTDITLNGFQSELLQKPVVAE